MSTTAYDLPRQRPSTNRPVGGRATGKRRCSPRLNSNNTSNKKRASRRKFSEDPEIHHHHALIQPRRSARGSSSLWQLARYILEGKHVVFITGAGLSVASGVPVFRTTNNSSRLYSDDMAWKNNNSNNNTKSKNGDKSPKRDQKRSKSKNGLVEEQPLGIWNSVLWTQATRKAFRKDPLDWYNDFWLSYFPVEDYEGKYDPNEGHVSLATLQQAFPINIKIITQNVDGLQHAAIDQEEQNDEAAAALKANVIEAHGRLGLYKCLPAEDSDTDSSSDEDDDRPVHLGHRRKHRAWKRRYKTEHSSRHTAPPQPHPAMIPKKGAPVAVVSTDVSSSGSSSDGSRTPTCEYQMLKSLTVKQLAGSGVRGVLNPAKSPNSRRTARRARGNYDDEEGDDNVPRMLTKVPRCPSCGNHVLPQSLLFDEGYHSHDHYNFMKMEDWLGAAEVLVFVGTSFAVTLPQVALDHAKEVGLPVFNFNISDMLEPSARLNAENIVGPSQETLPKLLQAIQHLEEGGVAPFEYNY